MSKKKDVVAILKAFENSSYWKEFMAKLDAKKKEIELELDQELVIVSPMSIHTLWRRMAKFIEELEVEAKDAFAATEGWEIVLTQIGLDILARKTNNYKAVQTDFELNNSEHDVLRSQRNYLEGLAEYPTKLIEIEQAELDKAEAEAAMTELEAIQEGRIQDELD